MKKPKRPRSTLVDSLERTVLELRSAVGLLESALHDAKKKEEAAKAEAVKWKVESLAAERRAVSINSMAQDLYRLALDFQELLIQWLDLAPKKKRLRDLREQTKEAINRQPQINQKGES